MDISPMCDRYNATVEKSQVSRIYTQQQTVAVPTVSGWVYRLHRAPAVGDLGGPGAARRPGHPGCAGGEQRLVPEPDPRQPQQLQQRAQGGRRPGGGGGGRGGGGGE